VTRILKVPFIPNIKMRLPDAMGEDAYRIKRKVDLMAHGKVIRPLLEQPPMMLACETRDASGNM
jgi:hypothetical protein